MKFEISTLVECQDFMLYLAKIFVVSYFSSESVQIDAKRSSDFKP